MSGRGIAIAVLIIKDVPHMPLKMFLMYFDAWLMDACEVRDLCFNESTATNGERDYHELHYLL